MSKAFTNGQRLKTIYLPGDETITANPETSIEVVMESGQMSGVAWALVQHKGRYPTKWNLALCEGVEILE